MFHNTILIALAVLNAKSVVCLAVLQRHSVGQSKNENRDQLICLINHRHIYCLHLQGTVSSPAVEL